MKKNSSLTLLLLLGCLALYPSAHAEISGSGSPNSGCQGQLTGMLWQDVNENGVIDSGEPGIADVTVQFVYDEENTALAVTTNAAGRYQLDYLCEGDYLAVIDESTVPEGLLPPETGGDEDDDSDEDLGGWSVEIGDDDDEMTVVLDLGLVGCDLAVNTTCSVASLATELYRCEKPIDQLSLVWNGDQSIRVVAHYGKLDKPVVADIDNVAPGDVVTVSGFAGAGDDVTWEMFAAGTSTKIGDSWFRTKCDDVAMDGPEDCGLPQGDGKDDKDEFINDWLLDGIVDSSGLMECTNDSTLARSCEFQSTWADCELLDKVNWLTFSYTGGDCAASRHDQPDKFECDGEVDGQAAITVLTESGDSFVVEPGESFTIPKEGGDTDIELSNSQGTQSMRIHTSCSQPLAAGDVFGSLTLAALNGLGIGAQIDYEYELENKLDSAAVAVTRELPFRTLYQPHIAVEPLGYRTVSGSAYVTATTASALIANHGDDLSTSCSGADIVNVNEIPRRPCEISGSGLRSAGHDIFWDLSTGTDVSATIERIEIRWPSSDVDKLKEIKLDGEKIFDQDRLGGYTLIERTHLEGDYHKRIVRGSEIMPLKIVFDDDIDELLLDDFEIEVQFRQGCSISNY